MNRVPSARLSGLDGLRAVAVLLVVLYHLFPALPVSHGFVGVDVFFVLSGFLITTLLLREREETGRIALGAFWRRRARRLLPAIALVVLVSASAAWVVGGDVLVGLGSQLLGAATFAYNWIAIAAGSSYFGAGSFESTAPELLRNLWSLAVEEQFYLLWPLLLPAVLLLRRWRVALAVALAAASAVWAWLLLGEGVTRVYYGTDTHAFGLLLGVALAFVRPELRRRGVPGTVGLLAVAGVVAVAVAPWPADAALFPALLVAASALTAVAIAAAVRPGARLGRLLDAAPLRWVGERSFGLYLWHWPIVVLLTVAATGASPDVDVPVWVGVTTLALTVGAAALSYRYVEQPIRRRGLRETAAAIDRALRGRPVRRFGGVVAVAAGLTLVAGTTSALVAAPQMGSSERVVAQGQHALDAASDGPAPGATHPGAAIRPGVAPLPPQCASTNLSDDSGHCVPPDGRPTRPAPAVVPGSRVSAVGDSVMLASAPGLLDRMPGIAVDAKVSRSMASGIDIITRMADREQLRDYVVVALGTNGPVQRDDLQRLRDAVGPDRTLVLVNASAPRDWIPGVNRTLDRFAAATPGVVVADWSNAIRRHTDLLAGDRIHPGARGGLVFADTVERAVSEAANERAEVEYVVALAQWTAAQSFTALARSTR